MVLFGLALLWILWVLAFFVRRARTRGIRNAKTSRISIFGVILQSAAYPVVWMIQHPWTFAQEPWRILLSVPLGILSLTLIWSALPALGKQWRLQAGVYADHVLIQSGPYRYIRHPIYSSMLALLLATGLLRAPVGTSILALTVFVAGTEIRIRAEERLLAERFGEEFTAYKARVPAYIPFLR
jgi:protein-S-isoprenylcysteine O-methyltransferase Ste14